MNKSKVEIVITWSVVTIVLLTMFTILIGRKLFPDSQLFTWLWWMLWGVAFPIALIAGYKILSKASNNDSNDTS